MKKLILIFLMSLSLPFFINAYINMSFDYNGTWGARRNSAQIGRVLLGYLGRDSLMADLKANREWIIYGDLDSTGQLVKLNYVYMHFRDENGKRIRDESGKLMQRITLSDSIRDGLEKYIKEHNFLFTFPIDNDLMLYKSHDEIVNSCRKIFKKDTTMSMRVNWPFELVTEISRDNYRNAFGEMIKNKLVRISGFLYEDRDSEIDYIPTIYQYDQAKVLFSMVYVFGDYNLDCWLTNKDIDLNFIIGQEGQVETIRNNFGKSPMDSAALARLNDFMLTNNITLHNDNDSKGSGVRHIQFRSADDKTPYSVFGADTTLSELFYRAKTIMDYYEKD